MIKDKTLRLTLVMYALLLVANIIYAYYMMGVHSGNKILVTALGCFLSAYFVCLVTRGNKIGFYYLFFTIIVAIIVCGVILNTLSYSFTVSFAASILVAMYVNFRRNVIFAITSSVALLIAALAFWPAFGRDANVAIFIVMYLCYLFTSVALCSLVYSVERRAQMLREKTKEALSASESKGNFLANMSHEIRTPMNAIQGLNQLILRDDISDEVRENALEIQKACSDLLTIINDVLDFSKIESGKMEIIEAEYEIKTVIQDTVNLIYLRTEDINVEMLVDCNPSLPKRLYGDEVRIKQIMMNLLTNAVKFTKEGYVKLTVDWDAELDGGSIVIQVEDTGIGIKKDSIDRLFDNFEQADTKRNRKVEGTGLGLAICKQLSLSMGGDIDVTSVYGEGSCFRVTLPQKVVSQESFVTIPRETRRALVFAETEVFRETHEHMFAQLNIPAVYTTSFMMVEQYIKEDFPTHYFVADTCYKAHKEVFEALSRRKEVTIVQDRSSNLRVQDGMKTLFRPFYVIPLETLLSGERGYGVFSKTDVWDFQYVAPKAKVLVVDDNEMNLRVTVGLMRPVNMQIVTANSGVKALNLIRKTHFDLVFMDHMMPEMDGMETTKLIRDLSTEKWDYYDTVPIIALTANAVNGAKEMFLQNGFQDFLAKPMELRDCDRVLRKWLPPEYIEEKEFDVPKKDEKIGTNLQTSTSQMWPEYIKGIDLEVAKHFFGQNLELFIEVLSSYYNSGISKKAELDIAFQNKDWNIYGIEAHALKSASKSIGAVVFAEEALELELAAKGEDEQTIRRKHKQFLTHFDELLNEVLPFVAVEEDENQKPLMRTKELQARLKRLEQSLGISAVQEEKSVPFDDSDKAWTLAVAFCEELTAYRFVKSRTANQVKNLCEACKRHDLESVKKCIAEMHA